MFYEISKILSVFLIPSNFVIGLGVVGIVLLRTRFAHGGRRLLVVSIALVVAIGVLPVGNILTLPLEARFPRWEFGQGAPSGIIILGGVINAGMSAARGEVALSDAAERITAAVVLARRYPEARVVFTGGDGSLIGRAPIEANFAARLLEDLGVPRDRISAEKRARSTVENAIFTKQLVSPKPGERWLLVTSAMHMPRAIGSFQKVGFTVEAYPVDYQTAGPRDRWRFSGSLMGGIRRTDAAVHEWLGLLAYWLTGRTNELFPGPM